MKKQRKCQGCRKIFDADLMHKITLESKSGKIFLNPDSKILGRSAYVCKDSQCIKTMLKKKALRGALKTNNVAEIEQELLRLTIEG